MQETKLLALAQWVASVSNIPERVRQAAVDVVADAVGSAAAGYALGGALAARNTGLGLWGGGQAAVWFSGCKGSVTAAAFANSMAASILDLDDGHRAAAGHPGAAIVPAVLAAAEVLGETGERVLAAIAIGYEVGIRIAAARDLRAIDTLVTGRWCGQGVAAAIGWLRGDDAFAIAEAMAVAGAVAPYMLVAEYTHVGNHTKEAIPFGVANGIMAGELARNGFKGPLDILDHATFDPNVIVNGSNGGWYIQTTYFKPYSCCRWIHAPIDAVLAMRDEVDWAQVREVEVATFGRTLSLNNQLAPTTVQAAQYSTPYCVAAAAIRGASVLQPMSDAILADAEVRALAAKVRLTVDPALDAMFPAGVPGRVTVRMKDGTSRHGEVLVPKGEATNPLTWPELLSKLKTVATGTLDDAWTAQLIGALVRLRSESDCGPLLASLAGGAGVRQARLASA